MDAPGAGAAAKDESRQNGSERNGLMTDAAGTDVTGLNQSGSAPESEPENPEASNEEAEFRNRWRRRFAIAAIVITLIAAAIILPPLVNIGRYKHQITALMARSLGRPVHLSSVGLRLLPMPGFVLQDLSVSEDPRFGSEPVLSAGTVVARVNLLALWSGKLEISRISVDEASLNLVRAADGRWNIDSLMLGAQPALTGQAQPGRPVSRSYAHFPYLEATNSWIHLKEGYEKKPYALSGTDLSLWQDEPGQWRFRLRGLPVRTDIPMSSADAGELRAEGSLRSAVTLRDMPLSLQIEWREAQLGQLSRLLLGSDSGWRGDVTADIEVHGTAENAQTRARLRVVGIRREEFTPQTTLNFDANCTLRYQHSAHAVHDLACDTDSGGGQIHLRADLPGTAGAPHGTVEVHDVPLQGGLDLLRSIRSGFAPGLSIGGKINGSLTYAQPEPSMPAPALHATKLAQQAKEIQAPPSSLRGELVVEGAKIEGDALKEPLTFPRITWVPATPVSAAPAQKHTASAKVAGSEQAGLAMTTRFVIPIGTEKAVASRPAPQPAEPSSPAAETSPDKQRTKSAVSPIAQPPARPEAQALTVQLIFGQNGYQAEMDGAGNITRLRELAYALGTPHLDVADTLSGSVDQLALHAAGPWLPSSDIGVETAPSPAPVPVPGEASQPAQPVSGKSAASAAPLPPIAPFPVKDSLSGTVVMRRAIWSPAFLVSPVTLSQVSFGLSSANLTFASDFNFGSAKEPIREAEPKAAKPQNPEPKSEASAKTGNAPVAETQNITGSRAIRGSVIISSPIVCPVGKCQPQMQLHFVTLNAADLQSDLLNTPQPQGFLAPLIDRMRSSAPAKLPDFDAEIHVDSLTLGTLAFPFSAKLHPQQGNFILDNWTATLFGGSVEGTGEVSLTDGKPTYSLDGSFKQANGSSLAAFTGLHASGGAISGSGQIQLTGLTVKDLAASVKGKLHFDWQGGSLQVPGQPAVSRFDDWSGDTSLSAGKAELDANTLSHGKQSVTVSGSLPFGEPAKLAFAPPAKAEQK